MRWFGVALVLMGCEPQALDEPEPETGEDVVEHCGDFVEEEVPWVSELAADEVLPERPAPPGVLLVEPVEAPVPERVPLERGDLDTSPLPRCQPWPSCLEALVRDKPLSGRGQVGLWLFDGRQVTAGPRTRALTGPLDGVVLADLQRGVLYELATRALTRVTTDGPRLRVCTGDEGASGRECQTLELALGVVELHREP
jgi:hypothetical protein